MTAERVPMTDAEVVELERLEKMLFEAPWKTVSATAVASIFYDPPEKVGDFTDWETRDVTVVMRNALPRLLASARLALDQAAEIAALREELESYYRAYVYARDKVAEQKRINEGMREELILALSLLENYVRGTGCEAGHAVILQKRAALAAAATREDDHAR